MTFDRVKGHWTSARLVIGHLNKFHQNWFKHFVETLDNVVDRKKLKNLRETEHRRIACACVTKKVVKKIRSIKNGRHSAHKCYGGHHDYNLLRETLSYGHPPDTAPIYTLGWVEMSNRSKAS